MPSNTPHRYFIELTYHGGGFHGWQIQPNARTVQEVVDQALSTVCRQPVHTVGCGRTDTGVHARQLFAHFDLEETIQDTLRTVHQLNALLPRGVATRGIYPVKPDAHARFDAIQRSYEYHIHFEKNPFLQELSHQMKSMPDIEKMNVAAQELLGHHDFSCFSKTHTQVFTNNCTVFEAEWKIMTNDPTGIRLIFYISADRFLRNMVRAIVGTLLEIGQGKQPVPYLRQVMDSKNRSEAGMSVPAKGLFLASVEYPYDIQNTQS